MPPWGSSWERPFSTVDLQPDDGSAVFDALLSARTHPVAIVCCSLGASYGVFARSDSDIWLSDSHGVEQSGAYVIHWGSVNSLLSTLLRNARCSQAAVQLTIFRPGPDFARQPHA